MAKPVFVPAAGLFTLLLLAAATVGSPVAAESVTYRLDPAHTQVLFSVDRFGFSRIIGQFTNIRGDIHLDEANPGKSSVKVAIGTASVLTGDEVRDRHLKGNAWFDAPDHPAIRFKSTDVERTGPKSAKVTGDLTIKDVTKQVVLTVTLNKIGQDPATQKPAAGFSASTRLSRTDFGMTTAPNLIGDGVAVQIEALAHRTDE